MKLPDQLDTRAVIECKMRGCGWQAEIPVLYRIEAVPGATLGRHGIVDTRVVVDRAAIDAFDAYLAGHLVEHEIAETVLEHADDPGPCEPAP